MIIHYKIKIDNDLKDTTYNISTKSMNSLEEPRRNFIKVSKYYNDVGKNKLNAVQKQNFKLIHNYWKNVKNTDVNKIELFKLKDYHAYINSSDFDEDSNDIWKNYIISCSNARCTMLKTANTSI